MAEVELLIPTLEQIFVQVFQLRVGLRTVEQKLERAGVSVDVDGEGGLDLSAPAPSTSGASESADVGQARAVFRGYYEALSDQLEHIRSLGGEVKDLDMGLVDFPGHHDDTEILLCWKLGEKQIEYWHPVDGGFANRRRLDERAPRSSSRLD